MKRVIAIIYLVGLALNAYTQCSNLNSVNLGSTCASSISTALASSDQTVVARDNIIMGNGFSLKGVSGKTFNAKIDFSVASETNNYLTGTNIVTGTSRALDVSNYAPGAIGGSINVSPTGAATYNIPVMVSPGSHGVQPNIGITYNSQSGNGILGYGWHLSGLSVISRAPKNKYYDNTTAPINLSDGLFSMDGQRLINVGTNTYSPESNPYIQVTTDANYTSFTVTSQDGTLMEYSQQLIAKGADKAYAWALTKVTDAEGNYMQYIYMGDNTTGEYRISEVKYTGNSGAAPYNSVYFLYDLRTDVSTKYIAGYPVNETMLLTSIKVMAEGSLAYEYNFSYFNDGYYSKLNQIGFTANGTSYNPTVIDWGATTPDYTTISNPTNSLSVSAPYTAGNYAQMVGDLNGDGLQDFAQIVPADGYPRVEVAFLSSNGSYNYTYANLKQSAGSSGGDNYIAVGLNVVDWDNDGLEEILVNYLYYKTDTKGNPSGYKHKVYMYQCSGTSVSSSPTLAYIDNAENFNDVCQFLYGDFDNNGKIDRIIIRTTDVSYTHNIYDVMMNGTVISTSLYDYGSVYSIRPIDFDGDGQLELLLLNDIGVGEIFKFNSSTNDFVSIYSNTDIFSKPANVFTGDINGDGMTDFIRYKQGNGWKTFYSTGTGFTSANDNVPFSNTNDPSSTASALMLADINGDGKSDIVYALNNTFDVYISKGMSFSASVVTVTKSVTGMTMVNLIATPDEKGQVRILYYNNKNNYYYLTSFANKIDNALYAYNITDGNNITSAITYDFYKDLAPATLSYPLRVFNAPIRQASNVKVKNGSQLFSNTTYSFSGGVLHLLGKGFLGFNTFSQTESKTSTTSTNTYQYAVDRNSDLYSVSLKSSVVTKGGKSVTTQMGVPQPYSVTSNYSNKLFMPVQCSSTTTDELKGTTTSKTLAFSGSIGRVTNETTTSGSWTIKKDYTYVTVSGYQTKLSQIKTTQTKSGETDYIHTLDYTYESSASFRVISQTEQGIISTAFSNFDSYGNPLTISVSANSTPRVTSKIYDAYGRFVVSSTDMLGYTSTALYRSTDGAVLSSTDINGHTTTYSYSSGGNSVVTSANLPDGKTSVTTLSWDNSGTGLAKTVQSVSYGNTITTYTDVLGRKVKETSKAYNGGADLVTTWSYNISDGSLKSITYPGAINESYQYDLYGRVTNVTGLNKNINYTYSGNTVTITDNIMPHNSKTQAFDELGNLISITGATTGNISYSYYSSGKPKSIIAAGGTTSMEYDFRGNQTKLTDPDAGITTYSYNAWGQLLKQVDAKGQATLCSYDIYGRLGAKTSTTGLSITYSYSTTQGSKGQVASITRNGISETYAYDDFGRTTIVTTSGPVASGGSNTNFETSYTYNASTGRLSTTTYPTGLTVSYEYDGIGNLKQINNASTGAKIWTGDGKDAMDRWTQYSLGNGLVTKWEYDSHQMLNSIKTGTTSAPTSVQNLGYVYNDMLQLTSRTDGSLSETFTYDGLDRLTAERIGNIKNYVTSYFANGNIETSSIAGGYTYNATHIHAVSAVAGTVPSPVSQSGTINLNTNYNCENKVTDIDNGTYRDEFTYGVDGNRFRVDHKMNNSLQSTKIYIGNNEIVYNASGTATAQRTFIYAPTGICAVYEKNVSGAASMYYVHADNQGSWLKISNASGVVENTYSYDAWGRPRDPSTWLLKAIGSSTPIADMAAMQPRFDRGYTGHEMLCGFGLINMNGRLYDPNLQRFLSPDPYVQAPGNAQSYNRYSYCMNNPLRYVDPSGYTWFSSFGDWLGSGGKQVLTTAVTIGVAVGVTAIIVASGGTLAPLAIAAIAGASGGLAGGIFGTALNGGSGMDYLKAGVMGIVVGGASGFVGGAAGQWAVKGLGSWAINGIASPVLKGAVSGAISGAVGGFAGGFTAGLIMSKGDLNAALTAGWNGAIMGGAIGAAAGSYAAYRTSVQNHIDPWSGKRTDAIAKYYPENDGAVGKWKPEILQKGTRIDRYGNPDGNYFSPEGTPIEMRSLPYDANTNSYNAFEVVKPLPVESSTIAPAFNGMGLGTQYRTSESTLFLLKEGYLKIIK